VDAYLRDLELLLHGIEPGERAEVLAGVHEHLEGRLGRETTASNDDVRQALGELGPPQAIADEAYAGRSGLVPARTTRPQWQAVTACAINTLGLVLIGFATWWAMGPSTVVESGMLFAVPWCATFVLSLLAQTWTLRQRLASALLFPATLVGLGVVVGISYSLVGPSLVDTVPAVAVLGAAVWVLVRLTKAALR
jgi:uncharacterized membrane protein